MMSCSCGTRLIKCLVQQSSISQYPPPGHQHKNRFCFPTWLLQIQSKTQTYWGQDCRWGESRRWVTSSPSYYSHRRSEEHRNLKHRILFHVKQHMIQYFLGKDTDLQILIDSSLSAVPGLYTQKFCTNHEKYLWM